MLYPGGRERERKNFAIILVEMTDECKTPLYAWDGIWFAL